MIVWLLAFLVLGAAAAAVGWPAYRDRRAREARALETERYLGWRGRARTAAGRSAMDDVAEARERRRLGAASLLGVAALACLVAFFVTGG